MINPRFHFIPNFLSFPRSWSERSMERWWLIYKRTVLCRRSNLPTVAAIQRKLSCWRWRQMPCSRPIRVSLPCLACSIWARRLTVWIMTSFWDASRSHSVSLDQRLGGFVCTWVVEGSTIVTVDRPQLQRPCCSSYSTRQTLSESLRSWTSPSMGTPTIYRFYDHCFVRDTQQRNDQLIHCIDCMGQWKRRNRLKLNATKTELIWLGSVRHLATCSFGPIVSNGEIVQLSLAVRAIWASSSIRPSISLTMSPGWQGRAISRFDSFVRYEDHWPLSPATPLSVQWSYRDWTIATVYLEGSWRAN